MNAALFFTRLYAVLLRLYPRPFRLEFAQEMDQVFTQRVRECRQAGPFFLLSTSLREYRYLFFNIFQEHLSAIGKKYLSQRPLGAGKPISLALRGGLAMGFAGSLGLIIGLLTGLSRLPYVNYTWATFVLGALLTTLLTGTALRSLWLASFHRAHEWGYLPGLLAVVCSNFIFAYLSKTIIYTQDGSVEPLWTFQAYIWPLIWSLTNGLVLGAGLGWGCKHRGSILLFTLLGLLGSGLAFGLTYGCDLLILNLFHNSDIPYYQSEKVWYWLLVFAVHFIGSMTKGALFGWGMERSQDRNVLETNP